MPEDNDFMNRRNIVFALLYSVYAASGADPNRKAYRFGSEMYKRIYEQPAGEGNPWMLMPMVLMRSTLGDITAVGLCGNTIEISKRTSARWTDIDGIVRTVIGPDPEPKKQATPRGKCPSESS
jgi:hypothetical protein